MFPALIHVVEQPFELGGMWVTGVQTEIMRVIKELGIELHPQYHTGIKVKLLLLITHHPFAHSTNLKYSKQPFSIAIDIGA